MSERKQLQTTLGQYLVSRAGEPGPKLLREYLEASKIMIYQELMYSPDAHQVAIFQGYAQCIEEMLRLFTYKEA